MHDTFTILFFFPTNSWLINTITGASMFVFQGGISPVNKIPGRNEAGLIRATASKFIRKIRGVAGRLNWIVKRNVTRGGQSFASERRENGCLIDFISDSKRKYVENITLPVYKNFDIANGVWIGSIIVIWLIVLSFSRRGTMSSNFGLASSSKSSQRLTRINIIRVSKNYLTFLTLSFIKASSLD